MKFLFLAVLVVSGSLHAEAVARHSAKLGIGFSGQSNELGIHVDFATPSLVNFKTSNDKTRSDLHLFFEVGNMYLNNFAQSAGSFVNVNNGLFAAGTKMQHHLADGTGVISPYSTLGAEMAIVSKSISTSSTSFGLRVGFGCDFLFVKGIDTMLGTSDSAFFVEGNLSFLHKKADKIAGSPTWHEGFFPRIGMRSHF